MKVTVNGVLKCCCQNSKKKELFFFFSMSNAVYEICFPVALCSVSPPQPASSSSPCHGHHGQLGSLVTPEAPSDWGFPRTGGSALSWVWVPGAAGVFCPWVVFAPLSTCQFLQQLLSCRISLC